MKQTLIRTLTITELFVGSWALAIVLVAVVVNTLGMAYFLACVAMGILAGFQLRPTAFVERGEKE